MLYRRPLLKTDLVCRALSSVAEFVVWDAGKNQTVRLTSRHPNVLSWYSCGPTVYASAHIGHASSYIRQDVIRRVLESEGRTVVQLMGVTDIDDKIIHTATQVGVPWERVSREFEAEFFQDLASLNVQPPHLRTRVTHFIPHILTFVRQLLQKGLAYALPDGSVYFDTEKYGKYGKLMTLSSAETEKGQGKKNRRDFAVWKGWKVGEPFWEAPWGKGRPGWHIECSAMASSFFGDRVDIHSGGLDLLFPHHENEEAQCCAHFGVDQWVTHWMHMGQLSIKGDVKMSKSLGNTITVRDFLLQNSAQSLRMFCLVSNYRNSLEYSPESLSYAVSLLRKFESFLSESEAIVLGSKEVVQSSDLDLWTELNKAKVKVHYSLLNDFNTSTAVQAISEFIDSVNRTISPKSSISRKCIGVDYGLVLAGSVFVQDLLSLLGLRESVGVATADASLLPSVLTQLVGFRSQVRSHALALNEEDKGLRKVKVRENKDLLKACDDVREGLSELGIDIKDQGTSPSFYSISNKTAKC